MGLKNPKTNVFRVELKVLLPVLVMMLFSATFSRTARQDTVTSLQDALLRVYRYNPNLHGAEMKLDAAKESWEQARSWSNPQIEMEAENIGATGSFRNDEGVEATAKVKKEFSPPGVYTSTIRLARIDTSLAAMELKNTRLEIERITRLSYFDVWSARAALELAKRNYEITEKAHNYARTRVLAGDVSPIDSVRTEMQLIRSEFALEKAESELRLAQEQLEKLWGGEDNAQMGLAMQPVMNEQVNPLNTSLDQWQQKLKQTPAWKTPEIKTEKLAVALSLEKSARIPGLEISGGVKKHKKEAGHAWVGGLSFPLPLWNWNRSGVAAARKNWQAGKSQTEVVHLGLLQKLRDTYSRTNLLEKQYRVTGNRLLPAARSSLEATLEGYQAGKYSGQLLLDAQKEWLEAEKEFLTITSEYYTALVNLKYLTGEFIQTNPTTPSSGGGEK